MVDDESNARNDYIVHLARLGLSGRTGDVLAYVRRISKKVSKSDQALASSLVELVGAARPGDFVREAGGTFPPIDADSRLLLVRQEYPVQLEAEPVLDAHVVGQLDQIVAEREDAFRLGLAGLTPTRTVLFSGPPGVGKTISARWVAKRLKRPLLILDLATVMSSFLGKTGANIRAVLDYAKSVDCVLLLDEIDAIAKKRDDDSDVGELKRLVTVLLQEIDEWPARSLLIAATNHSELLDPAVWRRFDDVITFPLPNLPARAKVIRMEFGDDGLGMESLFEPLAEMWEGKSSSDISRLVRWVRRRAIVGRVTIQDALLEALGREMKHLPGSERKKVLPFLAGLSIPDRRINAITGISRDTLRKYRVENPRQASGVRKEAK